MKRYVIKRLLIIIPTLWIISVIAFTLSKFVPQDQVSILLEKRGVDNSSDVAYANVYKDLGLDKPNFYFAIVPSHYPDNINIITHPITKSEVLSALKSGYHYNDISETINNSSYIKSKLTEQLRGNSNYRKVGVWTPKLVWHGKDNQYHNWIISFFNGVSIVDGKSALGKVGKGLQWTLSITLIDLILSIILAIIIGKYLVINQHKKRVRWISQLLYFIYSIPLFWMATMFVIYLTTDDYGSFTNIFPSVGMNIYPGKSTLYQIIHNAHKLILPILCLTIHSLAYSTRFMRRSLIDELQKPYISTAYSKGLTSDQVINKHAFRNAMMPMITIFVTAAANAFAGSLLLEVIFNIPGIGRLLLNSINQADWNVVFCIVVVIACVTTVIYLIGDILYTLAQPKLRYDA